MEKKSIVIIGAGFTGLAAGYKLVKAGFKVTVFEKEDRPGGLAIGFKDFDWEWSLEKHYHHLFTSDYFVIDLAREVEVKIIFIRPKTSVFANGQIYQIDSPMSLLRFPLISILERLRIGILFLFLRYFPLWKILEKTTAATFLKATMGENSWRVLWQPLFEGKFGKFAESIPASWFWARITKRSPSLGYPEGGFENLAESIAQAIERDGGKFFFGTSVVSIKKQTERFLLKTDKGSFEFDCVISTLPTPLFAKTVEGLPKSYTKELLNLKGIGAVNLVLALKEKLLLDNTYWLNISDRRMPFLALVEHTNFIDEKYYGGDKLVYVGNYLPPDHPYFKKETEDLVQEFTPYLKKINPRFKKEWIRKAWVFKAPFAQPIVPLNFSKVLPPLETPIPGLFMANIQQVYPWDRGTNYAVELGEKVAEMIIKRSS